MGKLWLTQEISEHPGIPGIKRFVNVQDAALQAQYEQVVLDAYITYLDQNNNDVTGRYKSKIENWILDNTTKTTVLNLQTGEPKANPDYVDEETTPNIDPYLKRPSFDYFFDMVKIDRVDMISLLSGHIRYDDALGEFNF